MKSIACRRGFGVGSTPNVSCFRYGSVLLAILVQLNAPGLIPFTWRASAESGDNSVNPEVHVVGIYESDGSNSTSPRAGRVAVKIDRPGKRVALILGSYEPEVWALTVTPGTILEKVYASGYYHQSITVSGATPLVGESCYEDANGPYLYYGYNIETGAFRKALPILEVLGGGPLSSFHGTYHAASSTPIVIDAVQNDPRLSQRYPEPTAVNDLPDLDLHFSLSFVSSLPDSPTLIRKDYTLQGPVGGGSLYASSKRAIQSPASGASYTLESDAVWKLDVGDKAWRRLPYGSSVPEVSWGMGLTYNVIRDQLLLVSLGGEGFLYAYSPASNRWGVVTSMHDLDLAGMTFHQADGRLYGLRSVYGEATRPAICRLDGSGRVASEILLPLLPFGLDPGGNHAELVSVGDYLVLLLAPPTHQPSYWLGEERIYLVDPRDGRNWLTYRRRTDLQPSSVTQVTLTIPGIGPEVSLPASLPLTAEASVSSFAYPFPEIQYVEFLADGRSLGWGRRTSHDYSRATFRMDWTNAAPGSHTLTAKAVTVSGGVGVSLPVSLTIRSDVTLSDPVLAVVSPTEGSVFAAPAQVQVEADVVGRSAVLSDLEFRLTEDASGGVWIVILPPAIPGLPEPRSFVLSLVPSGSYAITADGRLDGIPAVSLPVHFTVVGGPDSGGEGGASPAGPQSAPGDLRLTWQRQAEGGPMRLSFVAQPNAVYVVQHADAPEGEWHDLTRYPTAGRPLAASVPVTVTVTDASATGVQRYYRVRLVPVAP